MAFVQRLINLQISMANGVFDGGGNSATLEGLRIAVEIQNASPPSQGSLVAEVFGLPLQMMNQLTRVATSQNATANNTIIVTAGDTQAGMITIFQGYINVAFVNAQAQPHVSFHIEATAASLPAVTPIPPTSTQGSGDVATIMGQLAQKMSLAFENNSVSVKLSNPYLSGSVLTQAHTLAEHAGIGMVIENGTLAIWPAGGSRQGATPTISPQTGMVGYPAFTQSGIIVRTIFDPTAPIKMGANIQVQSDLTPACGTWNVVQLDYSLESQTPRGEWFCIAKCTSVGTVPP
jgi:hypothetical protein